MIVDILALLGSLCFLVASIGLIRLPNPFARIHAATKASSLGVLLFVVAAMVKFPTTGSLIISLMIGILIFLTAPMACQAIASRLVSDTRDTDS